MQAVARALDLLSILADKQRALSVTELAEQSELKLTTAHRLLNTMVMKGYVEKDPQNSHYRLGVKALKLARAASTNLDIRRIARPFMERLNEQTQETINLAILDRGEVIYIDQIESTRMVIVKMFARTGNRGPAYCTGSGKALLAYLPPETLDRVISSIQFEKFTSETIDDAEKLKMELEKIRRDGYALDLGERDEGVRCVAAPIFNAEGQVEAAISVAGPSHRLTNFYLNHELIDLVKQTAAQISSALGYKGSEKQNTK